MQQFAFTPTQSTYLQVQIFSVYIWQYISHKKYFLKIRKKYLLEIFRTWSQMALLFISKFLFSGYKAIQN